MKQRFYQSKKFWAVVTGCAVVVADQYFGLPKEAVVKVIALLSTYILGQGIADIGKHRAHQ